MKQGKSNTDVAGLDIGKLWLDGGLCHGQVHERFANGPAGFGDLLAWLRLHGVHRVGMEASGQYERAVREVLEAEGFEVVLFPPHEVKAFARYRRIRLKSDKADARLIAQAAAAYEGIVRRRDPELGKLAELMTGYEQVRDLLAQVKTMTEHYRLEALDTMGKELKEVLKLQKQRLLRMILSAIRARPDLAHRFDLLKSLPGIGDAVAACLVIRMPELGDLQPGQAASLLGVAPFDRDSGASHGKRFITGGRARPRVFVYLAALAAKRVNPGFKAFAQRLVHTGKPLKVVVIAVMRKLIEAANLVLKRRTPWLTIKP